MICGRMPLKGMEHRVGVGRVPVLMIVWAEVYAILEGSTCVLYFTGWLDGMEAIWLGYCMQRGVGGVVPTRLQRGSLWQVRLGLTVST